MKCLKEIRILKYCVNSLQPFKCINCIRHNDAIPSSASSTINSLFVFVSLLGWLEPLQVTARRTRSLSEQQMHSNYKREMAVAAIWMHSTQRAGARMRNNARSKRVFARGAHSAPADDPPWHFATAQSASGPFCLSVNRRQFSLRPESVHKCVRDLERPIEKKGKYATGVD